MESATRAAGADVLRNAGRGETCARGTPGRTPWIERKQDLGGREFLEQHLRPRRPVVLTDALRDWPALQLFTPDYFRRSFADAAVKVRGRACRLGDVLEWQLASSEERPGPYPCALAQCGSELLRFLTPRFAHSMPNRRTNRLVPRRVFELVSHVELFFGGPGGEYPYVHRGMLGLHAWIAQLYGDKEITLYEHGQEHLLYVNPTLHWLSRVQNPRDYATYPQLREARSQSVVLRAGDVLFVPSWTWHTSRCLSMNITVAFDQLEATNWTPFVAEVVAEERRSGHAMRARALNVYLRTLGPLLNAAERFGANRRSGWA